MFESAISAKRASFVFSETDTTLSFLPIRLPSIEMLPQSIPRNYEVSCVQLSAHLIDQRLIG